MLQVFYFDISDIHRLDNRNTVCIGQAVCIIMWLFRLLKRIRNRLRHNYIDYLLAILVTLSTF